MRVAHVVMGAPRFEVAFAVAPGQRFAVDSSSDLVGIQSDELHGLAAFWVRGSLPSRVAALPIDAEAAVGFDEERPLVYVGYPNRARSPRRMTGSFAGREGVLLLVDRSVGRGASGGPLMLDGEAVGLVTSTDDSFTYSVNAVVLLEALKGWNVRLGVASPPVTTPSAGDISSSSEYVTYTIKRGDNFISIARTCYGDRRLYAALVKYNKIKNTDVIVTGERIRLPVILGGATINERCRRE